MTAFLIRCCIIGHIKITIHSLYWDIVPYCDNNTASPLFFLLFLLQSSPMHIWTLLRITLRTMKHECINKVFTKGIRNLPNIFLKIRYLNNL